jgi:hypothetical protein
MRGNSRGSGSTIGSPSIGSSMGASLGTRSVGKRGESGTGVVCERALTLFFALGSSAERELIFGALHNLDVSNALHRPNSDLRERGSFPNLV